MARTPKERFCFNCGESLGVYADYDQLDTCGKAECNREAGIAERDRRDRAHEELDEHMGWDRRR